MNSNYCLSPEMIAAQSQSNWKVRAPFVNVPGFFMLDKRLNKNHYRVGLLLMRYASKRGTCWPIQGSLARSLGISEKTVNVAIQELIKFEWLKVCGRYRAKSGKLANVYHFTIPPKFDRSAPKEASEPTKSKTTKQASKQPAYMNEFFEGEGILADAEDDSDMLE